MSHFLYQLEFTTPVHFGNAEQGGRLEQVGTAYQADTLFGALCCELNMLNEPELLASFIAKVKQGKIRFSDLFPYCGLEKKNMHFYVPKPIILKGREPQEGLSYQAVKELASKRKSIKKLMYVRASKLSDYIAGDYTEAEPDFGAFAIAERVNCRHEEPLPYYVGSFSFAKNAGLYGILYLEDAGDLSNLIKIFTALGESGIGGKRSSGYGKFKLYDDAYDLEDGFYEDDEVLKNMLAAADASCQMCLSATLPSLEDLSVVSQSSYKLLKRGGFVSAEKDLLVTKKNSVYALAAGSCLTKRIEGTVKVVGHTDRHEVLRYGMGMYAGIDL